MKQHDKNKMNDALKKALRAISVYKKENDRMYKQLSTQEKDIRKLRLEFSETDKATRKKEKERARAMFGDPKKSILARNPMDFPGSGSAPQNSIRASFRESPASEIASDKPLAAISNAGSSRETKPTHDDDDGDDGGDFNFLIRTMKGLAKKHGIVLPVSLFERRNNALYNSVVMIDADGSVLPGIYRKSHIPDGTGYQEKFYFSPGDTGFKVWKTRVGKVGVAICWDQWFPEAARAMALKGADILLYPTAIGTEPQDATIDSSDHWQRVMQGHAAANMVPVVASNRYGTEILLGKDGATEKQRITFYGRSFITDETGAKVAEAEMNGDNPVSVIASSIDPQENRATRLAWGLFRDRRPDLYGILQTKDGMD
mmetsp:Transcript_22791/g.48434  ORF Transcript_22791/g.48434 Transcript_22791/m.48434 type:complete len:372 (+) Transcript_22791:96-1211(+)